VLCFLNPPVADRRSRTLTHPKKIGKQNFSEERKIRRRETGGAEIHVAFAN
jgi:hypothetical protein